MINYLIKKSLGFSILWAVIIFGLCCTPGRFIPTSNWLELLSFDKFVHASIFFILTSLSFLTLINKQKTSFLFITLVIISCICYGGLLEIMQATVFSQRSGDWFDFIANSFGCIIALLVFHRKKMFQYDDKNHIL